MHRRAFFGVISGGCLLAYSACRSGPKTPSPRGAVAIGHPDAFPQGSTDLTLERIVLVREEKSFGAMSMVCTHQDCLLKRGAGGFDCPCHGSVFDRTGQVKQGPAVRNLEWYELRLTSSGELEVNFAKVVPPEWRLQTK